MGIILGGKLLLRKWSKTYWDVLKMINTELYVKLYPIQ